MKPQQANNGEAVGMNKLADHVMLGPRKRKKVKDCAIFFYFSDNSSSAVKTIELIEKKIKQLPVG